MPTKDEALNMVIKNLELQEFNTVNATLISYCKEALEQPAWQGLTEEEFIYFTSWVDAETLSQIEHTLKEKNGWI